MNRISLFILLIPVLSLSGESPWGNDADLSNENRPELHCCERHFTTPLLNSFAETAIKFHQEVISPADGPRSHFVPSSSQYTLEAIRKYGFFQGFSMGCDRLMRENNDPWVYRKTKTEVGAIMKYDPVP